MLTVLLAYSYIRFSHPSQARGHSLERQMEASAEWCRARNIRLDTKMVFRDLGRSGWAPDDRAGLRRFLSFVEMGQIPPGSYLIIENLDRLTRDDLQPALLLVLGILQAGIKIVQLPSEHSREMIFDDKSDTMAIQWLILELSRANLESARKSALLLAVWKSRRAAARANGRPISPNTPCWLIIEKGKYVCPPDRRRVIQRIFALSLAGYPTRRIARQLHEENVPALGRSGHWSGTLIQLILSDRRVLGEYLPQCAPRRQKSPDPAGVIVNYYPRVIDAATWDAAWAKRSRRGKIRGRDMSFVNIFKGLLFDAPGGKKFYTRLDRKPNGEGYRIITNVRYGNESQAPASFSFKVFETAMLHHMKHIAVSELISARAGKRAADKLPMMLKEKRSIVKQINRVEAELESNPNVGALRRTAQRLEAKLADISERITIARSELPTETASNWTDATDLAEVLEKSPNKDAVRFNLRERLHQTIEGLWLVIARDGDTTKRVCIAQIIFRDNDLKRTFVISYRPDFRVHGKLHHEEPVSFSGDEMIRGADLRDRRKAEALRKRIENGTFPAL